MGRSSKKTNIKKRSRGANPLILFLSGGLLAGLFYLPLSFLDRTEYIYSFFFRAWQIQGLNTCLFFVAIIAIIARNNQLRSEARVLELKIEDLPTISDGAAKKLLDTIPEELRETSCFRRLSELLRGYLHKEEVMTLNEELARRDRDEIDSGHLLLNSLRQIIPVLGFLGTVLGLSLGMVKFPEFVAASSSVESLRSILKDFAASLSVAFDTTLLALGYTIVIVLLASLLRRKEESMVAEVDEKARELIKKLKFRSELEYAGRPEENLEKWLDKWESRFSSVMQKFLDQLAT